MAAREGHNKEINIFLLQDLSRINVSFSDNYDSKKHNHLSLYFFLFSLSPFLMLFLNYNNNNNVTLLLSHAISHILLMSSQKSQWPLLFLMCLLVWPPDPYTLIISFKKNLTTIFNLNVLNTNCKIRR